MESLHHIYSILKKHFNFFSFLNDFDFVKINLKLEIK